MSAVVGIRPGTLARRARRDVVVAFAAVALGIGFSAVRIGAGLDHAGLAQQLAAFASLGVASVALLAVSGIGPRAAGLRPPRRAGAILCPLLGVLAFASVLAISPAHASPDGHAVLVGLVFYAAAVAPAEELLFRGVLFAAVERAAGPVAAVLVSSAAFAAAHLPVYGPGALPLMLAGGLVLGWCRAWSRSLAAPVAVHALADLAVLWA